MIKKRHLEIIFIITLSLLVGVYAYSGSTDEIQTSKKNEKTAVNYTKKTNNPFKNINIGAKSAIVYDIKEDRILFAKNEEDRMPLASLTKLMSSVIANEILEPDEIIYLTQESINKDGDNGLFANEAWKAKDLLALTITSSSNDGANALKNYIQKTKGLNLIDLMNKKAKELGLTNTFYMNESGLDVNYKISGSYGSAIDTAKLLKYIYNNHINLFKEATKKEIVLSSLNYGEHKFTNTNKIVDKIPYVILSKTGFTDLAGGNLAIIFEKEPLHPIAVVVLGSTKEGRFRDVEKLIWAAIEE